MHVAAAAGGEHVPRIWRDGGPSGRLPEWALTEGPSAVGVGRACAPVSGGLVLLLANGSLVLGWA
jgi:hypothetical protein